MIINDLNRLKINSYLRIDTVDISMDTVYGYGVYSTL